MTWIRAQEIKASQWDSGKLILVQFFRWYRIMMMMRSRRWVWLLSAGMKAKTDITCFQYWEKLSGVNFIDTNGASPGVGHFQPHRSHRRPENHKRVSTQAELQDSPGQFKLLLHECFSLFCSSVYLQFLNIFSYILKNKKSVQNCRSGVKNSLNLSWFFIIFTNMFYCLTVIFAQVD